MSLDVLKTQATQAVQACSDASKLQQVLELLSPAYTNGSYGNGNGQAASSETMSREEFRRKLRGC